MKLLVTGALRITPEESAELENLGYEIYFMPDERVAVPENIPCEEIEAIICNGLFLYTPPDKFPKLRTVQLTSAGLDRVPMDYMDAHGIKVFNLIIQSAEKFLSQFPKTLRNNPKITHKKIPSGPLFNRV